MAAEVKGGERSRTLEVVAKLLELTQTGKLRWRAVTPKPSMRRGEKDGVVAAYETDHKGRQVQVFERTEVERRLKDPSLVAMFSLEPKEWREVPVRKVVLRLSTPEGGAWEFPSNNVLPDLLEAITYQVSGVDDFMRDILSEQP